jgi:hypothetical protein
MLGRLRIAAVLLAAALGGAACASTPPGTIQASAESLRWGAAPPSLPAEARMAVLEGDPQQPGPFTLRLSLPAGTQIAPHWHPSTERVTVLEGAVGVGFGDRYDDTQMRVFHAGGFYVNPPQAHHFVGVPQDTVIQITGEGPWELHFLGAQ